MLLDEVEQAITIEVNILRTYALHLRRIPELSKVWHILPIVSHPHAFNDVSLVIVVVCQIAKVEENWNEEQVWCNVGSLAMAPQKPRQRSFRLDILREVKRWPDNYSILHSCLKKLISQYGLFFAMVALFWRVCIAHLYRVDR